jgi:hypothetical protein
METNLRKVSLGLVRRRAVFGSQLLRRVRNFKPRVHTDRHGEKRDPGRVKFNMSAISQRLKSPRASAPIRCVHRDASPKLAVVLMPDTFAPAASTSRKFVSVRGYF